MRKRMIQAAAALAGVLMLGGCSAGKEASVPEVDFPVNSAAEPETVQIETQPETGTVPETETEPETETTVEELTEMLGSAPAVSVTEMEKNWYTEDGETLLLAAEADMVRLESEGYDALAQTLAERWPSIHDRDYAQEIGDAQEDYAMREDKSSFTGYGIYESVRLKRSDSTVISFLEYHGDYLGGAHGNYGYSGATFDVESGRELALADILSDAEGFYQAAADYAVEELGKNYGDGLFPDYKEYVEKTFDADRNVCWYLNAAGIVLVYSPYEVGPYAMGEAEVLLPYDRFGEFIKDAYISPHSEVVAYVPANVDVSRLIGEESVMLEISANEYSFNEVTVMSGMSSDEIGTFSYHRDAYVIRRDGRSFLIAVEDEASDDNETFVYEVTEGVVRKCDELTGAVIAYAGTDRLGIRMSLYVLGTYIGDMEYILDAEGKLIPTQDRFAIDTERELTVSKELPVTMDGVQTTLEAGTRLRITGTDNNGTAYFQLSDSDQTGIINYTRKEDEWQLFIGDETEYQYFETLPYAG